MSASERSRCRVGVVDYQAGNLHSIANAFEHLGATVVRARQPSEIDGCSHLVLPGVGAFGFCAERLAESGLLPSIERWAFEQRRPLLGICVGMQLLADRSDESPAVGGLGWIGGEVQRLPAAGRGVRVPHVGWNTVRFETAFGGFGVGVEADFYFDHSFAYAQPQRGAIVASCTHGVRFTAAVQRDNVIAAQFHPEKSQASGMRFLEAFLTT